MTMSRGSNLTGMHNYLKRTCTDAQLAEFRKEWSEGLRNADGVFEHSKWYALTMFDELARNVASLSDDPDGLMKHMVGGGAAISDNAANTFMKLMLKMLTPSLVARKLDTLWERDWQFGSLELGECDVDAGKLDFHMRDVDPVTHMGPIAGGYVSRVYRRITGCETRVETEPFSLTEPRPKDVLVKVRWSPE